MDLKEREIYQLPNGREVFARITRADKPILYNLSASESGKYELSSDGELVFNGRATSWKIDDLLATGRIAPPEVTAMIAGALESQME